MNTFTNKNLGVIGWDISPEYRSLIIKTNQPALSAEAKALIEADGFNVKDKAHITCFGSQVGKELSDAQLDMTRVAMRGFSFDDVELYGSLFLVSNPKVIDGQSFERESLVAPISSPTIKWLLQKLSGQLYVPLDQFLHVTVATRPDSPIARWGIGINNQSEFDAISRGEYKL